MVSFLFCLKHKNSLVFSVLWSGCLFWYVLVCFISSLFVNVFPLFGGVHVAIPRKFVVKAISTCVTVFDQKNNANDSMILNELNKFSFLGNV